MDCFASLAMTSKRAFTPSPRNAPEPLMNLPPKEGVGNAGCPLHPRPRVHLVLVERTRVTTSTPESPDVPARNGFNGFLRALPGDRAVLPPSPADMFCLSPVGPTRLRKLDASVGASGPHDFAVRCNISRPRAVDRSQVFRPALRSPRAQNAAASTASLPAFVTMAKAPLWGGMRKVLDVIWGGRKRKHKTARRANHHGGASPPRVPDAVQRPLRCSAEPGPTAQRAARWTPGSAADRCALRGIRGTSTARRYRMGGALGETHHFFKCN